MTALPPIRRQVVVPGTRTAAFEVFTNAIGKWWPLGDHSVYGAGGTVGFAGGRLVEQGPDGGEAVWGTVLDWQPPERLRITWHPGYDPARASEVEVRFAAVTGDLTLVTLEHRGWERFPDPAAARTEYDRGWPLVLRMFTGHAPTIAPSGEDGPVWMALMHTAGPALRPGEPVFAQPDFTEHLAFLSRLDDRGVLVAAGSLDGQADGMTVIRVPDVTDVPTYVRLAQEDDQSVVRGLMLVQVRPWNVALEGTGRTPPSGVTAR
jgi:uncharacterized protein YndB with AHSA1/START domain/uncharacterized protein YciI